MSILVGEDGFPLTGINFDSIFRTKKNTDRPKGQSVFLVGEDGFEPSKALPADLQSVPFGHSGIHPYGTYRARTYDPLLVRQMLSQLSYDPSSHLCDLFSLLLFSTNVNTFFSFFTDFLFFRQHISPLLPAFQTITCRFLPNALFS